MKKPITIWTIVLSLVLFASITRAAAQQRQSVATSTGTTATNKAEVDKASPEKTPEQIKEEKLLRSMTEEEKVLYQRKQQIIEWENGGQIQNSRSQAPSSNNQRNNGNSIQEKAVVGEQQRKGDAIEIPLSKFNDYPDSRKKFIQENPDKYFINNSK